MATSQPSIAQQRLRGIPWHALGPVASQLEQALSAISGEVQNGDIRQLMQMARRSLSKPKR